MAVYRSLFSAVPHREVVHANLQDAGAGNAKTCAYVNEEEQACNEEAQC